MHSLQVYASVLSVHDNCCPWHLSFMFSVFCLFRWFSKAVCVTKAVGGVEGYRKQVYPRASLEWVMVSGHCPEESIHQAVLIITMGAQLTWMIWLAVHSFLFWVLSFCKQNDWLLCVMLVTSFLGYKSHLACTSPRLTWTLELQKELIGRNVVKFTFFLAKQKLLHVHKHLRRGFMEDFYQ